MPASRKPSAVCVSLPEVPSTFICPGAAAAGQVLHRRMAQAIEPALSTDACQGRLPASPNLRKDRSDMVGECRDHGGGAWLRKFERNADRREFW